MARDAPLKPFRSENSFSRHEPFGYACASGHVVTARNAILHGGYKRGHGSCARRAALNGIGLYDSSIVGGGDVAMAFAALGREQEYIDFNSLSPAHAADYRRWAAMFHKQVRGSVGYVEGDILHLWHGEFADRHYDDRRKILVECNFDPTTDIIRDEDGCWRWNSPKQEMHQRLHEYFVSRKEDGRELRDYHPGMQGSLRSRRQKVH